MSPRRTSIWPSIYPRILDQVLRAPIDDHLLQRPSPGRAAGRQVQRAGRGARHRRRPRHGPPPRGAGPRPPRLAGPRAACRRRGRPQTWRPAGDRRHQQPGTGHRHGRRRPRDPGRVARGGEPRPAAHRPRRPPRGRAEQGLDLPEAPRRPARGRGRRQADARRPDRVDPLPAQPARRARPADRRPRVGARRDGRSSTWRRSSGAAPTSPSSSDEQLANTLDLLAGRYPSEEFSELRPRVVWNRVTDTLRARDGSKRLAVTSGGTIPDRGLFGVFLPDGTRVGELDEEMVYESRPGETFVLGCVDVADRGHHVPEGHRHPGAGRAGEDAVLARRPARTPARAGAGGRARSCASCASCRRPRPRRRLRDEYALDELAAANLRQYVDEQAEATGVVPDDRTIVVERFRDEIGDWRVCVLEPVRHAGPRAVGDGHRAPTHRSPRPARRVDVGRRRHRAATARGGRRAAARRRADRPRGDRGAGRVDAAADGAVLVALPGVRRPGVAAAAAAAGPAHAAVAAAPAGRRPARRGRQVPDVPDPAGSVAGVPPGRVRRARR